MSRQLRNRTRIGNENDENNNVGLVARARAKAVELDSNSNGINRLDKKPLGNLSANNNVNGNIAVGGVQDNVTRMTTRRRAALGDVSNVSKKTDPAAAGAATKGGLGIRAGSTVTNPTRASLLRSRNNGVTSNSSATAAGVASTTGNINTNGTARPGLTKTGADGGVATRTALRTTSWTSAGAGTGAGNHARHALNNGLNNSNIHSNGASNGASNAAAYRSASVGAASNTVANTASNAGEVDQITTKNIHLLDESSNSRASKRPKTSAMSGLVSSSSSSLSNDSTTNSSRLARNNTDTAASTSTSTSTGSSTNTLSSRNHSRPLAEIPLLEVPVPSRNSMARPSVLGKVAQTSTSRLSVASSASSSKQESETITSTHGTAEASSNSLVATTTTSPVQDWDDLDAEDFDDPLMVSEYVVEIFEFLYKSQYTYMPDADYVRNQTYFTWSMRDILVDWLGEVHTRFRLLPETLFLAVNIFDRYMSSVDVPGDEIQTIGITSMFIAAKYEEVFTPSVANFAYMVDNLAEEDILEAERGILRVLEFRNSYPNPMNFLRRISKADDYDINTRTIGKYLLEISLFEHRLLKYTPAEHSAAAMFLARRMLKRPSWDANMKHYSGGYDEESLKPILAIIVDYLVSAVTHEAFFRKYAHKRFLKASIIARTWAKENRLHYQLPSS
ncbi:B-type cyclin CLB2 [Sugiyamaella lignohabitans]|uniref:B-type cyclin CLB2 n=1 Tax=Sugiyamaella lignohabitans TaxID=796027 RepID=A0A167CSP3_9ASCO|nr:B-type cyclin CLB2 [Sugiyamaella lignohabitans]ANB12062.1 B-type cyclin CLB2 [Sugiyamaella lignohabitans]